MAKRFTSTEIWEEDWFLDMPNEYKLFWFYMLTTCDHAGFFKVNLRSFSALLQVKVSSNEALKYFNIEKERIKVITDNVWLIEDFFVYQYGHTFNINNPLHKGVQKQFDKYNIAVTSIRGVKEVNLTCKEKDKEIKKGGVGENKKGVSFSEDFTHVIFSDGSKQLLGKSQKELAENKRIKPKDVVKGLIN